MRLIGRACSTAWRRWSGAAPARARRGAGRRRRSERADPRRARAASPRLRAELARRRAAASAPPACARRRSSCASSRPRHAHPAARRDARPRAGARGLAARRSLAAPARRAAGDARSRRDAARPSPEAMPQVAGRARRAAAEGVSRRRLLAAAAGAARAPAPGRAPPRRRSPRSGRRWRLLGADAVAPRAHGSSTRTGRPSRADDIAVGSFVTAFPEGADKRELGLAGRRRARRPDDARGCRRDRRGWAPEGLSPTRRSARTRAARSSLFRSPIDEQTSGPPGLVCPCHYSTFDVRRGGQGRLRPGAAARCPSCRCARRRGRPASPPGRCPARSARRGGAREAPVSASGAERRARSRSSTSALGRDVGRCARRCATCSPTTGRSCWARSRCTRSWCSSLTGMFLALFFEPSDTPSIVYARPVRAAARRDGLAAPTPRRCDLSFEVPGGLLIRQTHHWAALVFIVADRHAPAADLLHRRVPQAARAQLA